MENGVGQGGGEAQTVICYSVARCGETRKKYLPIAVYVLALPNLKCFVSQRSLLLKVSRTTTRKKHALVVGCIQGEGEVGKARLRRTINERCIRICNRPMRKSTWFETTGISAVSLPLEQKKKSVRCRILPSARSRFVRCYIEKILLR